MNIEEFKNLITNEGEDQKIMRGWEWKEIIQDLYDNLENLQGSTVLMEGAKDKEGFLLTDEYMIKEFYDTFMGPTMKKYNKKGRLRIKKNARIMQDGRKYYMTIGGENGHTLEPRRYRKEIETADEAEKIILGFSKGQIKRLRKYLVEKGIKEEDYDEILKEIVKLLLLSR